jgi:hypothetical protein
MHLLVNRLVQCDEQIKIVICVRSTNSSPRRINARTLLAANRPAFVNTARGRDVVEHFFKYRPMSNVIVASNYL